MAAAYALLVFLVRRDIRRFGAGLESGFIYRPARVSLTLLVALRSVTYLALLVSVNPLLILLPSATLVGVAMCIATATIKKISIAAALRQVRLAMPYFRLTASSSTSALA